MVYNTNKKTNSGFALLITLITVSVVVSIGLVIMDLSVKQIRLSTNAKESEIAFHAANAGMECARYWRRDKSVEMETGVAINPVCFGAAAGTNGINLTATPVVVGAGTSFLYEYDFTWGADLDRCTEVTTLMAVADIGGVGMTITNMLAMMPGYSDGATKNCDAGSRCTVISVRGYNKPCGTTGTQGTVQREVLLQF